MIERWRNNERLLSPTEQPLVTLQRWGEHMNEVEFILRKTSTDIPPPNQPVNHIQQQQRLIPQPPINQAPNSDNEMRQLSTHSSRHESPSNLFTLASNPQPQPYNSIYQHHQYNLTRRPQTALGPLTSSNTSIGPSANQFQNPVPQMTRLNPFKTAMSASALPSMTNMNVSETSTAPIIRPHYSDDQMVTSNSLSALRNSHNGYQAHNESTFQQNTPDRSRIEQSAKNNPFEDLYSTVSKKTQNQPPAVPAKPRVNQIPPTAGIGSPHQQIPINNPSMNYYMTNQSPVNLYNAAVRTRHPPGYLDYLENITRSSLPQTVPQNPNFAQGNIFHRPVEQRIQYNTPGCDPSQINRPLPNNSNYRYSINGPLTATNYESDINNGAQIDGLHLKRNSSNESGIMTMRSQAARDQNYLHNHSVNCETKCTKELHDITSRPASDPTSSVSRLGHDMLKVIEEQKRVLINQKNELERLDKDQEYWDTKQNSEQIELVNRIESEIQQLEKLWKENQSQIKKLENQDLEKELEVLKVERVKIESEMKKQKNKLSRCENEIALCKVKIEQLEKELANQTLESENSSATSDVKSAPSSIINNSRQTETLSESLNSSNNLKLLTNGCANPGSNSKESKSSEDEDYENDSGGDASDDLNLTLKDCKPLSANVEKRGLISGIRSLKLEKSRAFNRYSDSNRSTENLNLPSVPQISKDKTSMNNLDNGKRRSDSNGQYPGRTANNNQYDFLLTL